MQEKKIAPKHSLGIRIARIVLKTIAFILLFVLLVFMLLFTPPVQKFLTGKVQNYLQNKLHTKVVIGRISFGLSGKIGLDNIYIEDQSKDTLVSGGSIRAHLNFLKLLSNEVRVKDLEMQDVTAKIRRILPDTVYNFQFIINTFVSESTKKPDTSSSAPMKLDIDDVSLKNINLTYTDVITGNDMFAHIGEFAAHIDTIDPYSQHFAIPVITLHNSNAKLKQMRPLVEPAAVPENTSPASASSAMKIDLGTIDLEKVSVDYGNDISALYTTADIGVLIVKEKSIDLQHNALNLDEINLSNSKIEARLGKTQQAKIVKRNVTKETTTQAEAGWNVLASRFSLNNNSIQFDDDNSPRQIQGMDFSHISANDLSLAAENFKMNPDSLFVSIKQGSLNEKSGLHVQQLHGDILYANNQSYLHDLYVRTPGTELKKDVVVNYSSLDDLMKHPEKVNVQLDLAQSKIQVRDVLLFAPQLKSNPALRNPDDVWKINVVGSGTMNQFDFASLRFAGLSNTEIDAHGSLAGLNDLKKAGGNFVINRFHTNQNDISLFTGSKLSNDQMVMPEDFTVSGNISGNSGTLNTKLNIVTPDGSIAINGKFGNLSNPAVTNYSGTIATHDLQVGKIMKQPATIGSLSATISVNGKGLTPKSIDTKFSVNVPSVIYDQYQYADINLSGTLHKTDFEVHAKIKDPNADADMLVSGNFSDHPAFKINGMIDSIKTLPLHLSTQPIIIRGKINGEVSDISADNITANILVTQALFVSGSDRLPLDTVQLLSGKSDTANYIYFKSSIASASLTGHYRLADLGNVIQNTIQPYFNTGSASQQAKVGPYHFNLVADVTYHPILSSFVPGLTDMKTMHIAGNFSSDSGMKAVLRIPSITYQGNNLSDLDIMANTTAKGLEITGNIAHLKNGNSFDVYDAKLDATALNNNIDFSVGIGDVNGRKKYFIAGLIAQPSTGTYTLQLKPGNLVLNYQNWTVTPGNLITISPDNVFASNFILQSGDQRLGINSPGDRGQQLLTVDFSNFRLATITGFIKADSVLADGLINGNIKLSNFLKQPNFSGDLTINDLSLRNDTVGNLSIHAATSGLNRYKLETTISGKGNDVSLTGEIATVGNDVNLDLDLNVKALQLHTMEGAMAGAIRNASGAISGNVVIKGTTDKPSVQGSLAFDKSSFVLSMLGSQFSLDNQKLSVTNEGLTFDNFTIKDSSGNALALDGSILTSNFVNYQFNLKLTARNFQLLNSTKKDNPLYYGRMNISSDLTITGTEVKPAVDGRITVNNGTSLTFVVPQPEQGLEERDGIVEFVDIRNPANDSLFTKYDSLNTAKVLGMDIALNIEIKREAIFNIIVDEANGDFLNAQGEAQLTAGIDPSGKITLTGNYTLEQGAYQLSFNFLQRKFQITKGSTITWTGEPTMAKLNVTAVYVANT
ncbi:MAG TPA: translocation/assembly module TamB domain-containing protein, partial [Chitinophagaceae bacterium]